MFARIRASGVVYPSPKRYWLNGRFGIVSRGRFGDALIPSPSRKTPAAERERVTRGIAQKERLTKLAIHSTEEAYKANVSASFLEKHPNALKEGFLGSVKENGFYPGEATFPWR
jgi:hypothetical protein